MLGVGKDWLSYSHVLVMCLLLPVQMTSIYFEWTEDGRSFVSIGRFENWEIIL